MKDGPAAAAGDSRYGGVVINERGEVLLFESKGHYGGYVWSFPKGTPEPGEAPEDTAARELREETNVTAKVIAPLPGVYAGTTSDTVYFVMRATGRPGSPGDEAQAVRWVTFERAAELIGMTTTAVGRERDLQVLADAKAFLRGGATHREDEVIDGAAASRRPSRPRAATRRKAASASTKASPRAPRTPRRLGRRRSTS